MNTEIQPTLPERWARNAIVEIHQQQWHGMTYDKMIANGEAIILKHAPTPPAAAMPEWMTAGMTTNESAKVSREIESAILQLTDDDHKFYGYDKARGVLAKFAAIIATTFRHVPAPDGEVQRLKEEVERLSRRKYGDEGCPHCRGEIGVILTTVGDQGVIRRELTTLRADLARVTAERDEMRSRLEAERDSKEAACRGWNDARKELARCAALSTRPKDGPGDSAIKP